MAEEQQVMKEPQQVQQVTTKEPQQVTTKNSKKVEAGKRLAEHNRRRREQKKREEQVQAQKTTEWGELNQYYGIGVVMAVGVIGGLVITFIEPRKEACRALQAEKSRMFLFHIILHHALRLTSLRWINFLRTLKNGQEEYSK